MSAGVEITCTEHTSTQLLAIAARCGDAKQTRRLLAIALILEGTSRAEAARQTGMDRQTLRDWAHRFNAAKAGFEADYPHMGEPARTMFEKMEVNLTSASAPSIYLNAC